MQTWAGGSGWSAGTEGGPQWVSYYLRLFLHLRSIVMLELLHLGSWSAGSEGGPQWVSYYLGLNLLSRGDCSFC